MFNRKARVKSEMESYRQRLLADRYRQIDDAYYEMVDALYNYQQSLVSNPELHMASLSTVLSVVLDCLEREMEKVKDAMLDDKGIAVGPGCILFDDSMSDDAEKKYLSDAWALNEVCKLSEAYNRTCYVCTKHKILKRMLDLIEDTSYGNSMLTWKELKEMYDFSGENERRLEYVINITFEEEKEDILSAIRLVIEQYEQDMR